ncbi:MAG: response regulator [Sulfurimonas sp.]|jgi:two-component system KDP operon response regulator KdpE
MKPKILIVDDEKSIQKLLDLALGAGGYITLQATTAKEGLLLSLSHLPHLILLDLTLPDMDGKDFLKQLREWSTIPVIILSSRDNEETKIALLEGGADDYVTKPFSTGELLARIKATLRRFETENCTSAIIESENLILDINNHTIHLDNSELKCTPKEFELLKLFMKHKGKVLTYNWLLKEVWGVGYQQEVHYLRIFINQLRQKIEPNPSRPTRIRTETGIGYRFVG